VLPSWAGVVRETFIAGTAHGGEDGDYRSFDIRLETGSQTHPTRETSLTLRTCSTKSGSRHAAYEQHLSRAVRAGRLVTAAEEGGVQTELRPFKHSELPVGADVLHLRHQEIEPDRSQIP